MLLTQEYSSNMTSPQLREPSFWVLTALAGGRNHGYALIRQAEALSDGRVSLKVPTLYAALDRLRDQGLVATDGDEVIDGRLRRYFRLTDDGASLLGAEIERMETNARQAKARLTLRATAKGAKA
jgi:PadR family transcriptional regulator PadR